MVLLILVLATGCDQLPGKPTPEERWKPATEVTDFSQLYAVNCAGCHGADGRLGAARPLNDPLYLALVSAATLRAMIAQGVPGTSAPALAQQVGGPLTDKQIDILVEGMRSRWGKAESFNNVTFPHTVSRMPAPKARVLATHSAAQLFTKLIAPSATVKMAMEVPKADR